MRQNVDKKKKKKKKMNNLLWFLGKTFHTRLYYSKTPLPASADLKCRSHSKTKQTNKKTSKCTNFWKSIFFSCYFCLVGFCLILFKWVRNRDVAGVKVNQSEVLSHVRLFATPWTVAYQAPLSMGFSRQ